jgi:nucleotide-binding universal stress UspA family protein
MIVIVLVGVAVVVALSLGWAVGHARGRRPPRSARPEAVRRILLPFTGSSISRRAFDAAVRLARAEDATLMPCFLATVPLNLPLDSALPARCLRAMPLLETIEQRAARQEVPVDSRIMRGRTYRDALRRTLDNEHFDRVIVSATSNAGAGFSGDDLVWLLQRADAEVLILRPAPEDHREVAAAVAGHF